MAEVTHREIMETVKENTREIKEVREEFRRDIADIREDTAKMLEITEAYSAIKTGGKFVSWSSKILAGLLAIWVVVKAGAQFLVDMGGK